MTIQVQPWNGDPAYDALTVSDVNVGIASGDDILVDGVKATISQSGSEWFVNGKAVCTYFGNCAAFVSPSPQQTGVTPAPGTVSTTNGATGGGAMPGTDNTMLIVGALVLLWVLRG